MHQKVVLIIFLHSLTSWAQQSLGTWNILNLKWIASDKWNVQVEGQVRSLGFYNTFHYHEIKSVTTYAVNPGLRLAMGFGKYDTYRETGNFQLPKNNDEFRLWPQVVLLHKNGRIQFEHRYRTELRFATNGFRSRFRYRFTISCPFLKSDEGGHKIKLSTGSELFFSLNEPYFERNRFNFGCDFLVTKELTVLIGYLHQFDYKILDETGRDFLQVGAYFSFGK
ncbi:MAG: hypothetical protein RIT43_1106 [Bacteroidota bacterium]|jgi:hypothetical protein